MSHPTCPNCGYQAPTVVHLRLRTSKADFHGPLRHKFACGTRALETTIQQGYKRMTDNRTEVTCRSCIRCSKLPENQGAEIGL